MKNYIIRKAKVKDINGLLPLYKEFMDHHGRVDPILGIIQKNKEESVKYLRKTIYGNKTLLLVAEEGGRYIGFLGAGLSKRPKIYKHRDYGVIFDAFVIRQRRRRGVNRQMLKVACTWLREKGIKQVELGVSSRNVGAVKAWDLLGFKDVFYRKRKIL